VILLHPQLRAATALNTRHVACTRPHTLATWGLNDSVLSKQTPRNTGLGLWHSCLSLNCTTGTCFASWLSVLKNATSHLAAFSCSLADLLHSATARTASSTFSAARVLFWCWLQMAISSAYMDTSTPTGSTSMTASMKKRNISGDSTAP
jgi:hypothetical protein